MFVFDFRFDESNILVGNVGFKFIYISNSDVFTSLARVLPLSLARTCLASFYFPYIFVTRLQRTDFRLRGARLLVCRNADATQGKFLCFSYFI